MWLNLSHECHVTNFRVLPHICIAVDGVWTADNGSFLGQFMAINLSRLGQHASDSRHGGKQSQGLLDTVLQVSERLQVFPSNTNNTHHSLLGYTEEYSHPCQFVATKSLETRLCTLQTYSSPFNGTLLIKNGVNLFSALLLVLRMLG